MLQLLSCFRSLRTNTVTKCSIVRNACRCAHFKPCARVRACSRIAHENLHTGRDEWMRGQSSTMHDAYICSTAAEKLRVWAVLIVSFTSAQQNCALRQQRSSKRVCAMAHSAAILAPPHSLTLSLHGVDDMWMTSPFPPSSDSEASTSLWIFRYHTCVHARWAPSRGVNAQQVV
jgi:hypothetical protein